MVVYSFFNDALSMLKKYWPGIYQKIFHAVKKKVFKIC